MLKAYLGLYVRGGGGGAGKEHGCEVVGWMSVFFVGVTLITLFILSL